MDNYVTPQWDRSALLTIDMQRDFSQAGATLHIPGTSEVVPALQRALDAEPSPFVGQGDAARPLEPPALEAASDRKTISTEMEHG